MVGARNTKGKLDIPDNVGDASSIEHREQTVEEQDARDHIGIRLGKNGLCLGDPLAGFPFPIHHHQGAGKVAEGAREARNPPAIAREGWPPPLRSHR